jgi:hypothetical protein
MGSGADVPFPEPLPNPSSPRATQFRKQVDKAFMGGEPLTIVLAELLLEDFGRWDVGRCWRWWYVDHAAGNLLLTCMILISWQTNPLTRAGPSRGIGTVFSSQILLGVAPAQGRSLESPPTDQSLPGIVGSKTGR